MTLLMQAEHDTTGNFVKPLTRTLTLLTFCMAAGVGLAETATDTSPSDEAAQFEATLELLLDDGNAVDITFSDAFISFIPEEEAANKTTMESITLAIMNNPEMSEIFVTGLFAPPAAGGPAYNQNLQAERAEEEAALYDPNKLARLETSIAATILFGQLTEIQIIPDFRPPNFDNQVYNTTPRP